MKVEAKLKYLRISPKKVRLLTGLIKRLPVKQAETQLKYSPQRSARSLEKLLKSAIANAENNFHLNKNDLFISQIRVDEGPALKRWRPRSRGVAYPIKKRSSHIFLTLEEINPSESKTKINSSKEISKRKKINKIEKKEEKEKEEIISQPEEVKHSPSKQASHSQSMRAENKKVRTTTVNKPKIFRRKAFN